jgi:ATP-dependent DNA helicase RecQ
VKLKLFTFTFDPDRMGFDDAALQAFLRDREALSVSEHFFVHEHKPVWAMLVSYRDVPRPGDPPPAHDRAPGRDWRAELDPPGRALYDTLREWRGRAARRDGVAPYLIFNNRQMAEVARRRPATIGALAEVEGIGDTKCRRWGTEILALVTVTPIEAIPPPSPDAPVTAPSSATDA